MTPSPPTRIMKLSRYATIAAAAIPSCYYARAFSNTGVSSTSQSFLLTSTKRILSKISPDALRHPTIHSALPMIFDKFFSSFGGGGAFGSRVDYASQEYPVPELAELARSGQVSSFFSEMKVATFAGGCFWGLELAYQRIPGVSYTIVGYTQGSEIEPNYDQVCAGATGHTEAVMVLYDPQQCSYEQLLEIFFDRVDPLTANGQGSDRGKQYRTGVYYHSEEQEEIAREMFVQEQIKYSKQRIATECQPAKPFWPAEEYHQQYLQKGGRFGTPQSAKKGCHDEIRCYG